jgi:hypothetical protein
MIVSSSWIAEQSVAMRIMWLMKLTVKSLNDFAVNFHNDFYEFIVMKILDSKI